MLPLRVKLENNNQSPDTLQSVRYIPWLVLLLGIAVTWLSWNAARQQAAKELHDYFDFRVREAYVLTEQRLLAQEQVLRGAQGLFAASRSVGRDEFRSYVASIRLEENYPGIQGIGFSLIVPSAEKAKHITTIRKESGHPEYYIRPEGERDPYTSIIYLEPFSGRNLRAFGYDMYSEPVRRAAMERARDSGIASLSGKVKLVQENDKNVQAGFLMYLPVYRNGAPQGTVQERRDSIIGWVYSPFRMNDMATGMYGERAADLDIEIYDGDTLSPDTLMYDSVPDEPHGNEIHALSNTQRLNVADHIWTLAISSQPALASRVDLGKPVLVANVGAGASLMFAVLAWLLVSGRSRALVYARKMNRELIENERALHDSEEKLQAVLNASEVAIAWAGEDGAIEYVNPKFISLFGYTLDDVPDITQWYLHAYPDAEYRAKAVDEWNQKVARSLPQKSAIESMEVAISCKDGTVRDVLLMGSWAGGKLLANFSDITSLKQIEHTLRESEERWKFALEGAGDGVWDWDIAAGKMIFSRRWYEIQGFEEGSVGPEVEAWRRLVHPDDLPIAERALQAHFRGETHSFSCEHRVRCKNGEYKWILGRGMVVRRDAAGNPLRAIGTHTDITERKHLEESLTIREKELTEAQSIAKLGSWHVTFGADTSQDIWTISKELCKLYGHADDKKINFNTGLAVMPPEDQELTQRYWTNAKRGTGPMEWDHRIIVNGEIRWMHVSAKFTFDANGSALEASGTNQDITARKQSEEIIERNEANLRAILDNIPYLVWLKDRDSRFVAVNQAFLRATGKSSMNEVVGKTDFDLWPLELAQKYRDDDLDVMDKHIHKLTEEQSLDKGVATWTETFKAPILDHDGKLLGTTGFSRDITERKHAHELVQHMAHYDNLTGLPNRALFSDRMQQALAIAHREKTRMALIFIDLDKFKPINDELGHQVGDLLLKEVAQRMQRCMRESDTVARLGGDEFVVLLPVIEAAQDALLVAEKIREALNLPFVLSEQRLCISSSAGVAVYPEHGKDETQLMKKADVAMYHAKKGGRNSVALYRLGMQDDKQ